MTDSNKKKFPRKNKATKKKTSTKKKAVSSISKGKKVVKRKFSEIKSKPKLEKKPKDFFEEVMNRIKWGDYRSITNDVLKSIDKQDQIDQLVQVLNKSQYRAYRLSLKNFNYTIHQYKKNKNPAILKAYLKNLETDRASSSLEVNFRTLVFMQTALINSLLDSNVDLFEDVVRIICEIDVLYDYDEGGIKIKELYLEILIQLIDFKWPGKAKGLRVLYGKN